MSYLYAYTFARRSGKTILASIASAIRTVSASRRREKSLAAARRERCNASPF